MSLEMRIDFGRIHQIFGQVRLIWWSCLLWSRSRRKVSYLRAMIISWGHEVIGLRVILCGDWLSNRWLVNWDNRRLISWGNRCRAISSETAWLKLSCRRVRIRRSMRSFKCCFVDRIRFGKVVSLTISLLLIITLLTIAWLSCNILQSILDISAIWSTTDWGSFFIVKILFGLSLEWRDLLFKVVQIILIHFMHFWLPKGIMLVTWTFEDMTFVGKSTSTWIIGVVIPFRGDETLFGFHNNSRIILIA